MGCKAREITRVVEEEDHLESSRNYKDAGPSSERSGSLWKVLSRGVLCDLNF